MDEFHTLRKHPRGIIPAGSRFAQEHRFGFPNRYPYFTGMERVYGKKYLDESSFRSLIRKITAGIDPDSRDNLEVLENILPSLPVMMPGGIRSRTSAWSRISISLSTGG